MYLDTRETTLVYRSLSEKKNADEKSEARPKYNHEVQEFAGTALEATKQLEAIKSTTVS
jgi:hypothetical protein